MKSFEQETSLSVLKKNREAYKNRKLNLLFSQFAYEPSSKNKLLKHALKRVNMAKSGLRILDIGFGNGLNIFSFNRTNGVYGVEIIENMVDFANRMAQRKGYMDFSFKMYDGYSRIPFGDDFFDVVICSHVLEHVPDDEFLLEEMFRMLRKGGFSFIIVPINGDDSEKEIHARVYTRENLGRLLAMHKFKIIYEMEGDKSSNYFKPVLKLRSKHVVALLIWAAFNAMLSKLPYRIQEQIESGLLSMTPFTQYLVAVKKE